MFNFWLRLNFNYKTKLWNIIFFCRTHLVFRQRSVNRQYAYFIRRETRFLKWNNQHHNGFKVMVSLSSHVLNGPTSLAVGPGDTLQSQLLFRCLDNKTSLLNMKFGVINQVAVLAVTTRRRRQQRGSSQDPGYIYANPHLLSLCDT